MARDAARIQARITALEATQDKLDTYPVDEVKIGDKTYKLSEARVVIEKQLSKLYDQLQILTGTQPKFTVARIQEPTL